VPAGWLGAVVFVLALAFGVSAVITMIRAGSNVPTDRPTTIIVEHGPYRFTRNPIYLGMFLGQVGLAVAFNNLWLLMTLVPLALVIRYGVVAREEVYLARKFNDLYCGYCVRVRRLL
jgi:protein-S-isoprenylcysteine O-methyltransferase Ste14